LAILFNGMKGDESTLPVLRFNVGHGPRPTTTTIVRAVITTTLVCGDGTVEHVVRHSRLVDMDQPRCGNLAVDLHHRYAAHWRLHRL